MGEAGNEAGAFAPGETQTSRTCSPFPRRMASPPPPPIPPTLPAATLLLPGPLAVVTVCFCVHAGWPGTVKAARPGLVNSRRPQPRSPLGGSLTPQGWARGRCDGGALRVGGGGEFKEGLDVPHGLLLASPCSSPSPAPEPAQPLPAPLFINHMSCVPACPAVCPKPQLLPLITGEPEVLENGEGPGASEVQGCSAMPLPCSGILTRAHTHTPHGHRRALCGELA